MLGSQTEEKPDDNFGAKELLRVHKASLHPHYEYIKSPLNQTDLICADFVAVIMFFIVITVTSYSTYPSKLPI